MPLEFLTDILLPLSLFLMVMSLGLDLSVGDFLAVVRAPRAFVVGLIAQMVLLPLVAVGVVTAFALEGGLALGVLILAVCPGGVTSNVLTRLASGSVALSVSLTAVTTCFGIATAPLLTALWLDLLLGAAAPVISVTALSLSLLVLTGLPLLLGMVLRAVATGFATTMATRVLWTGIVLFVFAFIGTLLSAQDVLVDGIVRVGGPLVVLAAAMLLLSALIARTFIPQPRDRTAVIIETTLQNGPIGVTIALIIEAETAIEAVTLPPGLYAGAMYLVAAPLVATTRRVRQSRTV